MTDKLPLSAFIITLNEEDRLGPAIESLLPLVDDIVVVDSGSTDGTVALATRLGARTVHHDFAGYGPQKRFAEAQCGHDWVINLDADERVTPELAAEIRGLFAGGAPAQGGYHLPILQLYPHQTRPTPGAFEYDPVRLYDRSRSRYSDSPVHDRVVLGEGVSAGRLKGGLLHQSIRSLSHLIEKSNAYTDKQVADMLAKGRRVPALRLAVEFPLAFAKAYVGRRYFLMGAYGIIVSTTFAYFRFMRLAKLYEANLLRRRDKP
ncbi:glycosyltransferase family 2 protein [Oleomonas cavernae]|uniref:Glycosyltransferase family 2 protein n=1 Tax=Oleomonas cavernae TaxID=2320859 RepID=A0A418WG86_9PROT|nr:glycosyltransferase family 2 protein [Oleomonas cavernae]RJF89008.1 glycosyltransferase family 2 protein [Oleomonas cavernae]